MRGRLLCVGIGCLAFGLSAPGAPATKVGVVSSCHDAETENLLVLTEALLSKEPGLVLLDRRQIALVMGEQQRNACGLINSQHAVQAGKLLGVELFAVVEGFSDPAEGRALVVYEAATGVRLLDELLPAGKLDQTAGEVAAGVRRGEAKRRQRFGDMLTVGLLLVRNVDLPPELTGWCSSLGLLVERQMVRAPSLAVLERQRLEHVSQERGLPTTGADPNLWASMVTWKLDVSRGAKPQEVVATAFLNDAAGKLIAQIRVTGTTDTALTLAHELTGEILKALNAKAGNWPPASQKGEALRFYREALMMRNEYEEKKMKEYAKIEALADPAARRLADQASANDRIRSQMAADSEFIRMIEAAYALDPKQPGVKFQLASLLWCRMPYLRSEDHWKTMLVESSRALDLYTQMGQRCPSFSYGGSGKVMDRQLILERATAFHNFKKRITEQWMFIMRQRYRNLGKPIGPGKARTHGNIDRLMLETREMLLNYHGNVTSNQDWINDTITLLREHLRVLERYAFNGDVGFARMALYAGGLETEALSHRWPWGPEPPFSRELQAQEVERLRLLFEEMTRHPDPIVTCYGHIGLFGVALRGKKSPLDEDARAAYGRVRDLIRKTIAHPYRPKFRGKEADASALGWAYRAARDAIDLVADPEFRKREHLALFDWMLARGDVDWTTVTVCCFPILMRFYEYDQPDPAHTAAFQIRDGDSYTSLEKLLAEPNFAKFRADELDFTEAKRKEKLQYLDRALATRRKPRARISRIISHTPSYNSEEGVPELLREKLMLSFDQLIPPDYRKPR